MSTAKPFRIIAYLVTVFFALLILYPLFYICTNAMKDSGKIYDIPPTLLPESAKSLTIVMDYSDLDGLPAEKLLEAVRQDHVLTDIATIYQYPKESIFEIKFYGTKNGRTVYYSRAHRTQLDLEKDNGVYRDIAVKQSALTLDDKIREAADQLGYEFDAAGLPRTPALEGGENSGIGEPLQEYLHENFALSGRYTGIAVHKNNGLLWESFLHYIKLPGYVYSRNETLARYSFAVFFFNTAVVLCWAVLCQTTLCALTAFPLSRLLPKKTADLMLLFFLGTTMIPFVAVMIPQFTMFKSMGLYDNYPALLLPHLLPYGFFVYLYKGFFDNLPESLFEAARTDGASSLYLFTNICIPLSKPIISVVALQTFLSNWNDFFWAWMVSERQELWTLNVALYNISKVNSVKPNFIMGLSAITIIPVWLFTILFSNQIKESISTAGIKG